MSAASPPVGSGSRSWLLPAIWVVVTIAVAFAIPSLPWRRALAEARHMQLPWVAAAILANLAILPLWALEWRILVPGVTRVAYTRMFEVVALTASVLNSVPLLAGEISAVALLIGRAGLSRGAALSVLAMDQLLVAFAKISVLATAALVVPLPAWLRGGILTLVVVLGALLACLIPLAHRWTTLQARLLAAPSRFRILLADLVSWGVNLDALREGHRAWKTAFLALTKKVAELAAVVAVQAAFGLDASLASGLLVLGSLAISTMIPIAPANLGVYEATVFAVYRYVGVPTETALGLAVVQHLCFLLPSLGTGYVMLTFRQLVPRPRRAS